jgi:antitoxin ParD1/3/4
MTTMNVSLPDEMRAFIEAQVSSGGYASASEFVRALVRERQKREAKRELEAKLREALMDGPAEPMTREDWDDLERRVWQRHERDQARPGS